MWTKDWATETSDYEKQQVLGSKYLSNLKRYLWADRSKGPFAKSVRTSDHIMALTALDVTDEQGQSANYATDRAGVCKDTNPSKLSVVKLSSYTLWKHMSAAIAEKYF